MDNNKLKIFAQETRRKLIKLVGAQLQLVLSTDSAKLRGREEDVNRLRNKVNSEGVDAVVEEMSYTWFNRVMALRFMDANGYNWPMVVTPAEGASRPEILADALAGRVAPDLNISQSEINELLQGRSGDSHPQETLYRRLFIAKCNVLGSVMPFLFERIQDFTELLLPDDLLSELSFVTDIRNGMSDEDCQHEQIVGWLYQFYITDRKAEAEDNKSRKGGLQSDEQAAATQLFTPDWIVRYMVENTLGRIWLTLHPQSPLRQQMRYYIDPVGSEPEPIPEHIHSVKDILFLDPCMGSGHVLVYAFSLFAQMYEEEGYEHKEIPNLIFENNICGMDIDHRCYQLASFALTMAACHYTNRLYLRHAVAPKVIALQPIEHEVIDATGTWPDDSLMWQFEHIDTIGSLLKVTRGEYNQIDVHDDFTGWKEQLLKDQAEFLAKKYDCVVTNPPYLGKGIGDDLKMFCKENYSIGKTDMYAAFILRCMDFTIQNGYTGMVTMESWMFLSGYESLRNFILKEKQIRSLSHFDWNIMHIAFGTVSFIIKNHLPENFRGVYSYLDRKDVNFDLDIPYEFPNKLNGRFNVLNQKEFFKLPGNTLGYWGNEKIYDAFSNETIDSVGISDGQNITGDNEKYLRFHWEIELDNFGKGKKWVPIAKGGDFRRWYGNIIDVVNWSSKAREEYKKNPVARIQKEELWYRKGITWNLVSSAGTGFRYLPSNSLFNKAAPTIVFKKNKLGKLDYVLGFLNTKIVRFLLKLLNPTINTNIAEVFKLPLIFNDIKSISKIVKINKNISKLDWDSHEISCDFACNPLVMIMKEAKNGEQTVSETILQPNTNSITMRHKEYQNLIVNLKRICHTQESVTATESTLVTAVMAFKKLWEGHFMQLHANEEALNRQFIDIYGLQDELTPDVPLKEITILQQGEIDIDNNEINWHDDVLMKQLISYFIGCSMGRYTVEKPGLILANQGETIDNFKNQVAKPVIDVDNDGIIPVLDGDYFSDDATERVKKALRNVFGKDSYSDNLHYMEKALGKDIRSYLTKDFYRDHCQMYQKRPIYWMFSSKKGTFKALVYMHRLTPDTLSRLLANYVQPFIGIIEANKRQQEELTEREDIPTKEKNRARKLVDAYNKQLIELHDYEQELMELASHRIAIDLDDGVKQNYPKFGNLVVKIK
jgi:hypothetical protein|nr:BREX-1 system adenine-specific DNA-methyltransferase PglX [uncultured Prevotella sp.]